MYKQYYFLDKKPFDLTPDPDVVFMSEAHQEAMSILRYGVLARKGFLLLTGDVGTGKTTLLQLLVQSIDAAVHLCLIVNPSMGIDDFYYYLCSAYGLPEYDGNKAKFTLNFTDFLRDCLQKRERVLLIVDEAHVVSLDMLEEIRLLSNQDNAQKGVLSIFLVGQPEFNDRLNHERLLPLRQRVGIRFHLQPFSLEETKKYILFRLRKAGAQRMDIFSTEAIEIIHRESGGIPRLINTLCDHALLSGFVESKPRITAEIVHECVAEFRLPGEKSLALPGHAQEKKGGKPWMLYIIVSIVLAVVGWGLLFQLDRMKDFGLWILEGGFWN